MSLGAPEEVARPARAAPKWRAGDEADLLRRNLARGLARFASLQYPDGRWQGDYGGPMFLLPMYVFACRLCGRPLPDGRRADMVRYLRNVQRPDGAIGLHAEGPASLFTSSLCYVALRLLGVEAEDSGATRLRSWIRARGGPLGAASWGKLLLAMLGLYEYQGLTPILPELWLLPDAAPFHPGRLWCHTRQVYLPMAWLYGRRARGPEDELTRTLREELYLEPYHSIDWPAHRGRIDRSDSYLPAGWLLGRVNGLMELYEEHHRPGLRQRALQKLLEHIQYEDQATSHIRIGPVNAVLNTLVHHFRGAEGAAELEKSWRALDGYLWAGHDGTKMNGYNSCALWDTAFAVQALLASSLPASLEPVLELAHDFIRENQVIEDLPAFRRYYREPSRGGWPFSDRAHGWPISDCTAEGLKAALALEPRVKRPVPEELLQAAVRLLLGWQNRDGGWSTYEPQRSGAWLEWLNPSQVFGDIMVDYSHIECTSSCLQALAAARHRFPGRFDASIEAALRRGARFLRRRQRGDGSFEGFWGVCFTYGTWFGVAGLRAAGVSQRDPAVQRACDFLERWQGRDGGWGEAGESCAERRWVPRPDGHVVQTAWALHTLVRGGRAGSRAAQAGARFLLERQEPDGDWPRQSLCGAFNRTVLINYENYRRTFPLWALADYGRARGWIC